ncbi:hypothetical protein EDC04DRAFT_2905573 [Pisolithus marmoratus]|nr:hypothetical protein EDC04DRAFT_2905573 [Pisolithus marmoratus]
MRRAFHEPAMDLIWETLTAVDLTLQNLSSARIVSEGRNTRVTLSRPLSDNDWNTVRRLSSRVRRLHTFINPSAPYVPWFGCLTSPPDPSFLFPNLRALSFRVSIFLNRSNAKEEFQAIVRFFFLLLGPHLSALRITTPGAFYAHFDLPSIPLLCPNIRILDIVTPDDRWDVISMPTEACKALKLLLFLFLKIKPYDQTPSTWPPPVLERYQACRQLRVIALDTPYSLTLADNDLEDMIKAWPHLEVFHLFYGGTEYPSPVQLTLRGVTALLFHCPKLTHFALTFDATRVPEDAVPPSHETYPPVKYMGVYRSPVLDSSDVAAYLSTILPYLEIIGVDERQGYWPEWRWICTQHDKRPTMDVDRSPMKVYFLLSAGSKYTNEWLACNTEWDWHSRRNW